MRSEGERGGGEGERGKEEGVGGEKSGEGGRGGIDRGRECMYMTIIIAALYLRKRSTKVITDTKPSLPRVGCPNYNYVEKDQLNNIAFTPSSSQRDLLHDISSFSFTTMNSDLSLSTGSKVVHVGYVDQLHKVVAEWRAHVPGTAVARHQHGGCGRALCLAIALHHLERGW